MARTVSITRGAASSTGTGELIPQGTYDAVISNVETKQVKRGDNAGEDMYAVECKIIDGPQKGRKATKYVMLFGGKTGKAWISYAQLAAAVGEPIEFDDEDGDDDDETEVELLEPRDLIGEELRIKIEHEPYKDNDGNEKMGYRLTRFLPADDGVQHVKEARPSRETKATKTAKSKSRARDDDDDDDDDDDEDEPAPKARKSAKGRTRIKI